MYLTSSNLVSISTRDQSGEDRRLVWQIGVLPVTYNHVYLFEVIWELCVERHDEVPSPPLLAFWDVFWRKLFDSRIPMTLRAQDKPMVTPTLQTPLFLVEVSIRGEASLFPGINYINMCSYKSCVYSVSVYEPDLGRWLFGNSKSTMMDVAEGNSSAVRI